MDRLERMLSGLSHLNLDGQIVGQTDRSCDVFSAWVEQARKEGRGEAASRIHGRE